MESLFWLTRFNFQPEERFAFSFVKPGIWKWLSGSKWLNDSKLTGNNPRQKFCLKIGFY